MLLSELQQRHTIPPGSRRLRYEYVSPFSFSLYPICVTTFYIPDTRMLNLVTYCIHSLPFVFLRVAWRFYNLCPSVPAFQWRSSNLLKYSKPKPSLSGCTISLYWKDWNTHGCHIGHSFRNCDISTRICNKVIIVWTMFGCNTWIYVMQLISSDWLGIYYSTLFQAHQHSINNTCNYCVVFNSHSSVAVLCWATYYFSKSRSLVWLWKLDTTTPGEVITDSGEVSTFTSTSCRYILAISSPCTEPNVYNVSALI